MCFFDFTLIPNRYDRWLVYIQAGSFQIQPEKKKSQYTNHMLTLVLADQLNRTSPALFTYDPNMRSDRANTAKRRVKLFMWQQVFQRYNSDPKMIVYAVF